MEEYMSLTHFSTGQYSLTYDKYFMIMQNACTLYCHLVQMKCELWLAEQSDSATC